VDVQDLSLFVSSVEDVTEISYAERDVSRLPISSSSAGIVVPESVFTTLATPSILPSSAGIVVPESTATF
jgi:hypothetical protein